MEITDTSTGLIIMQIISFLLLVLVSFFLLRFLKKRKTKKIE